ncbi:hypothetical protein [Trichormus azollae]|uniref:hypothetical protein n=1 Tax=Trichormus azollae TaxID=1164 RepID=UPI00325C3FB2
MGANEHSTYHRSLLENNQHWQSPEFEEKRKAAIAKKADTLEVYQYCAELCRARN